MITQNTVFILGAGASADFDYPLGEVLRVEICQNLKTRNNRVAAIAKTLVDSWPEQAEDYFVKIINFAEDLHLDADYSIDAFLERFRSKYLSIGKLAIAQTLALCENENALYEKDNWYRILRKGMIRDTTIDTFHQNKVSFITFNYDRSLEHFLFTALKRLAENMTEERVIRIINQIPIIHLYGQLDPLPWQDRNNGRTYGSPYTPAQFRNYKKNISIVFEDLNAEIESGFNKAYDLLDDADRIYLLGFGWYPENIRRLRLHELITKKRIRATSYGLEREDMQYIREKLKNVRICNPNTGRGSSLSNGLELYDVKIYDFFKNHIEL